MIVFKFEFTFKKEVKTCIIKENIFKSEKLEFGRNQAKYTLEEYLLYINVELF